MKFQRNNKEKTLIGTNSKNAYIIQSKVNKHYLDSTTTPTAEREVQIIIVFTLVD